MPTEVECVCCQEISAVVAKCDEAEEAVFCMTLHPGFQAVATNPWNMQAVYNDCTQDTHEKEPTAAPQRPVIFFDYLEIYEKNRII